MSTLRKRSWVTEEATLSGAIPDVIQGFAKKITTPIPGTIVVDTADKPKRRRLRKRAHR